MSDEAQKYLSAIEARMLSGEPFKGPPMTGGQTSISNRGAVNSGLKETGNDGNAPA